MVENDAALVERLDGPAWTNIITNLTGDLPDTKERDSLSAACRTGIFRTSQGLVSVPVLTAEGTLRTAPGYDPDL